MKYINLKTKEICNIIDGYYGKRRDVKTVKAKSHIARLTAACLIATAMFGGAASAESITVTAERLNMRKAADASSKSVDVVTENEKLSFISETEDWYQVEYDGKTGYVMKDYVSLNKNEVKADVEANTEPCSASAKANIRVNMRQLPMLKADIEKVIDKNDSVDIIGRCGDWYQVRYGGRTGYVMAEYLTIGGESSDTTESAPADTSNETVYATAKSAKANARVNMREKASADSEIEKVIGAGDSLSVLGEAGSWYKVSFGGKTGYVMKSYVDLVSAESTGGTETLYASAANGETAERVNMRKTASTGASIVKVVDKGRSVKILGESGSWYKVEYHSQTGYIAKDYIRVTGGTDNEDETVDAVVPDGFESYPAARTGATNERVNLRESASTGASVLKVLNKNTSVSVLGEQGSYYQVKCGDALGFIAKEYVTLGASGEAETPKEENTVSGETLYSSVKTMYTTVRVNMRREPEGDVLHTLSADTAVSVIGEAGSWYKVTYSSSTGYISKAYLSEKAAETAPTEPESDNKTEVSGGTTGYITGASVNMRKGAGTGYGVVKVLKQGEEITFYTLTDGWYLIKAGGDTGYVSSKYVSTVKPESAPAQPENSGSDAEVEQVTGKVKQADWWTSDIQKIFKVGVIATVTDVDTGLSWRVKRSGGSNHADVQPLTAEDTAKMKKAYGGSWSWNRRAIWVTIDGVTYAASMNGMPHGTGSIKDNNFDGHHCIHFLNSRTHTGNRWDTAHQAAVQKAYKAGQ